MFRSVPISQVSISLVEPLENRRLLSTVFFGSVTSMQARAAHQAHLAHLAHVRHVQHVRHVAHVRLLQQAAATRTQNFLTIQPPPIPMMTTDLTNPVAGLTNPVAGLTNPVAGLDTVTPVLTTPASDLFGTMSPIDTMNPITGPTPIVSLTTNPFSFSTTPIGFTDSAMFSP